jgi:hypothetical protein
MAVVRPGDIVAVGADPPMHALVVKTSREGITRGHLLVQPLCGHHSRRDVLIRDVHRHWRSATLGRGATIARGA